MTRPAYRPYVGADFGAVRDFLVASYPGFDPPHNWLIDRWSFVASVGRVFNGLTEEAWEAAIGLWVDPHGGIVAMANEEEGKGEVFLQALRPEYLTGELVAEMMTFAETHCLRPQRQPVGSMGFRLHVQPADAHMTRQCAERGYTLLEGTEDLSQRPLTGADPVTLPPGYRLADGRQTTPLQKADAHARAFGYYPDRAFVDTRGVEGFARLQAMPDYRPELDIAVVGRRGTIDAFCGGWLDRQNRLAVLEPVGTSHDCRRKGLARAAVFEVCNRAHRGGATRVYVGSSAPFYQALGFRRVASQSLWEYRAPASVSSPQAHQVPE